MIELVPNYYHKFKCKADKCRHTCCAGWEIDIDPEMLARYREAGPDIMSHVREEGDTASFILEGEEERCPFLNEDGLCRLILKNGNEDLLCNICRDHPRFRNYRDGVTETGLGLACEEAARIVLAEKEPFRLVELSGSGTIPADDDIYILRDRDIEIMTDRSIPLNERISRVCGTTDLDSVQRAEMFLKLEILDPEWRELLNELEVIKAHEVFVPDEICYENLIVYYLFRYPMYSGRFALENVLLAVDLCISSGETFTLEEIVRRQSVEVEYSDMNPGLLADMLGAER